MPPTKRRCYRDVPADPRRHSLFAADRGTNAFNLSEQFAVSNDTTLMHNSSTPDCDQA